jgi:ribosomal protein S10
LDQIAIIKINSTNLSILEDTCNQIIDLGIQAGIYIKGPIPRPTKIQHFTSEKTNDEKIFKKSTKKTYQRTIEIRNAEESIKHIMKLKFPEIVDVELSLI